MSQNNNISDVEITSYWADGSVREYYVIFGADRLKAHNEGNCDAMCAICYADACDYLDFLEIQKQVS